MLSALIGMVVVGIVACVALVVVLALITAVFGVAFGLLGLVMSLAFKLLPLMLVGWVVVKLVQRAERPRSRISASDRAWLDG